MFQNDQRNSPKRLLLLIVESGVWSFQLLQCPMINARPNKATHASHNLIDGLSDVSWRQDPPCIYPDGSRQRERDRERPCLVCRLLSSLTSITPRIQTTRDSSRLAVGRAPSSSFCVLAFPLALPTQTDDDINCCCCCWYGNNKDTNNETQA